MPSAIVMAGGTGGHIFPALAVADRLREQGWHIHWLGTADRMEAEIVPRRGYEIHFLPVKGLRGKGLFNMLLAVFGLIRSTLNAMGLIKRVKPDLVLGFGGYPSAPGGIAAKLARTPLIIHEQNAVPGLTNRLLGKLADEVLLGFPQASKVFAQKGIASEVVGNPIRTDIKEKVGKAIDGTLNLFIVGGSLGAQALNETLPLVCKAFDNLNIVHQCGKGNQYAVAEAYAKEGVNAQVADFIDDVASHYAWADAIICRAGALTVSEIAQAGVAACFVPLPHAVDDHQTKNAQSLVEKGAAFLVPQATLFDGLTEAISQWLNNPQLCADMGEKAKKVLPKNATIRIVEKCEQRVVESA
ncbi:undecaprenyldiphospho-muramoylpentapeptide beta-N-acetylglucosaminyltransferase [Alteromonas sediminis]|uniref:UDP-N-acetylglucosamine--N-acetylmuramyl-(pentapeptide) pyrophosphoryl-undecaprenol N-acetylglucosamine transferase n=1 Tax=Alteromonas sediminis TaxID=2259342 RepID=A0A3N5Y4U3_9ALTE|nr:undecaprenyldiphospho-muramoylpentapeptide beta-N-acetylglucosaminyltransferase [Alteromonas sediminis]RPJ67946.1 undecaprenyldiphospho-muramoylpentapeptide beta-N-acetylglucosaminyltransferase [Alteromonas sediminis]